MTFKTWISFLIRYYPFPSQILKRIIMVVLLYLEISKIGKVAIIRSTKSFEKSQR